MNLQKDRKKDENAVQYVVRSLESKEETSRCRDELDSKQTMVSNLGRSTPNRELSFSNVHGLDSSIPKRIMSLDEKYLLHCIELIQNCALRTESKTKGSYGMVRLPERRLVAKTDLIINTTSDHQSIGSSPLLKQFSPLNFDVDFRRTDLHSANELPVYSDFVDKLGSDLSYQPQNDATAAGCVHRNTVSLSSTNISCAEQSSSIASATSFQGMLQCTWNNGLPHHIFSVDDRNEVYIANMLKVDCSDDKALDYVYSFLSRRRGKNECDSNGHELETVATMQVSSSITFSPNNSEIKETRFVLSVSNEGSTGELQTLNKTHRKNRSLTRRVANAFKSSQSYKRRSPLKLFSGITIFEDIPWEPSEDAHISIDPLDAVENRTYVPNLELAAIVAKEISDNCQEADLGGWGLKFLKKSTSHVCPGSCIPSVCSTDNSECSTSFDVLIPADLHGGPKTGGAYGPSSLIERWVSGGCCDCGGWDIGCPLTILKSKSSSLQAADDSGECSSLDLFQQGSKQDVPIMKMVNIHDGLYYIHFQSSLSSLQCFAIAAASIHLRN